LSIRFLPKVFAMKLQLLFACLAVGLLTSIASADDPARTVESAPTKATFLITGLHCPPCTRTVEAGLLRTKGVRSVSVDWRTHNAKVEFDEAQLPAQVLAQRIAGTPHMMGGGMSYGGWLALKAEGVKDETTAEEAKAALLKVPGVAKVVVYPAQSAVGVLFEASGDVTSAQLIETLRAAGVEAGNLK
jgi:copper chaperone CopZ